MATAIMILLSLIVIEGLLISISVASAVCALLRLVKVKVFDIYLNDACALSHIAVELSINEKPDADQVVLFQHAREYMKNCNISIGSMEEFFLDYYVSQKQAPQNDCEEEPEC